MTLIYANAPELLAYYSRHSRPWRGSPLVAHTFARLARLAESPAKRAEAYGVARVDWHHIYETKIPLLIPGNYRGGWAQSVAKAINDSPSLK